jgi:hypothetical protein
MAGHRRPPADMHLTQRARNPTWYRILSVPKNLQGELGGKKKKRHLTQSLQTTEKIVARQLASMRPIAS